MSAQSSKVEIRITGEEKRAIGGQSYTLWHVESFPLGGKMSGESLHVLLGYIAGTIAAKLEQ